jgi:hypothetical protein
VFAEASERLLLEPIFLGAVTDLAGYRFDQRGQIERRSRGGGLADVARQRSGAMGPTNSVSSPSMTACTLTSSELAAA